MIINVEFKNLGSCAPPLSIKKSVKNLVKISDGVENSILIFI